jgi:hypothetical protein
MLPLICSMNLNLALFLDKLKPWITAQTILLLDITITRCGAALRAFLRSRQDKCFCQCRKKGGPQVSCSRYHDLTRLDDSTRHDCSTCEGAFIDDTAHPTGLASDHRGDRHVSKAKRILKLPCRLFPLLWRTVEASYQAPDFQDSAATALIAAALKVVSVTLWQKAIFGWHLPLFLMVQGKQTVTCTLQIVHDICDTVAAPVCAAVLRIITSCNADRHLPLCELQTFKLPKAGSRHLMQPALSTLGILQDSRHFEKGTSAVGCHSLTIHSMLVRVGRNIA